MIYDISVPLSGATPVYEGDPPIEITPEYRIAKGDSANVSLLRFGSHTGTHVDPPFHFVDGGLPVDALPLGLLIGECFVCEVESVSSITADDLEQSGVPDGVERVLLRTRNSDLWQDKAFHREYVYLEPEGADWLVRRGVRLVGIDYLSIERFGSDHHAVHRRLLEAGVVIVEGLDLRGVEEGIYTLVCLPLRIQGGDGAPARAVLIR